MTDRIIQRARRILHIDMDAFFAAVEEKRRPDLAGKPVVIGGRGDPFQRGVVSTANYAARKFGIHSAMPLRTAFKLCPRAVFLPVDYEAYRAASRRFKAVLRTVTSLMEDVGIDEAYLDVSGLPDPDGAIADRIQRGIEEQTGLTCSIGIAPNKLLAKIASDMRKPKGVTVLREEDIEGCLWPLPVRKLYGVGPRTEMQLMERGVVTIGQAAALPLEKLTEFFGKSYGRYLHEASRGIDDRPLVTHWEPKSMSRETTFPEDVRDWQMIAGTLADLTREVVADMKDQGYRTKTVTLKIRFEDFTTLTRATSFPEPTDSGTEIRMAAFACLKRVEMKGKVRLVGVRAGNLHKRAIVSGRE